MLIIYIMLCYNILVYKKKKLKYNNINNIIILQIFKI